MRQSEASTDDADEAALGSLVGRLQGLEKQARSMMIDDGSAPPPTSAERIAELEADCHDLRRRLALAESQVAALNGEQRPSVAVPRMVATLREEGQSSIVSTAAAAAFASLVPTDFRAELGHALLLPPSSSSAVEQRNHREQQQQPQQQHRQLGDARQQQQHQQPRRIAPRGGDAGGGGAAPPPATTATAPRTSSSSSKQQQQQQQRRRVVSGRSDDGERIGADWIRFVDDDSSRHYYYNVNTGFTTWDDPFSKQQKQQKHAKHRARVPLTSNVLDDDDDDDDDGGGRRYRDPSASF